MAGDWIKMRTNLWDDPRVSSLCDATGQTEAAVIGALYWLWSAADDHSEDGVMPGLSPSGIDRKTGLKGIGAALIAIGWMADHPEGVRIVRFEEHNGQSAKRRCTESRRKVSARDADNKRTESGIVAEEKQQESAPRRDVDLEKSKPTSVVTKERATATRLPTDWSMTPDDAQFCIDNRPDLNVLETASRFRDYWVAQPGVKGRKADWPATWRNWVRNEKAFSARASPSRQSGRQTAIDNYAAEAAQARGEAYGQATSGSGRTFDGDAKLVA